MADKQLNGVKIAILATDGFEQVELVEPKKGLEDAGATCHVIAPKEGSIRGWNHTDWGDEIDVDQPLNSADPNDYDALLLPGGVLNPDKLRMDNDAVGFVRRFFDDDKPVAAICHGPQTMIDAGVVKGRKMTSYEAVKNDLKNAGANWVDQESVTDGNLTTSRKPDDIPAFIDATIELFAERLAKRASATA